MGKLKLSSPWEMFFKQVEALFKKDPDVKTEFDEDTKTVKLYVDGTQKAEALEQIMPKEKDFGGVTVKIEVIPANEPKTKLDLFKVAFDGNDAFVKAVEVPDIFSNKIGYCVFKKEVVQFWGDNLGDINGNCSTLYENLAKEIFDDTEGVFFCTDNNSYRTFSF